MVTQVQAENLQDFQQILQILQEIEQSDSGIDFQVQLIENQTNINQNGLLVEARTRKTNTDSSHGRKGRLETPLKIPDEILTINIDELNLNDKAREVFLSLLNFIEEAAQLDKHKTKKILQLEDTINHLKGEKGRPKRTPNVPNNENTTPKKKKRSKTRRKRRKKAAVKIDRTETVKVDENTLPPDAEFKGYRTVVIQELKLVTDNVLYIFERYHSKSENKTYEGMLPGHVDGEFGPNLKALTVNLYFGARVPENKILKFFTDAGISISSGQISNILTKMKHDEFSKEREAILEAGLQSTNYVHTDDTSARHQGINHHVHVICAALFSVYAITRRKNRETVKALFGIEDDEVLDKILISDDAKQYWFVAFLQALCWLHEIRHYKKLNPVFHSNKKAVQDFLTDLWEYYDLLNAYRENPSEKQKQVLFDRFDSLFSPQTGYRELDKRIGLTREKKERLLLVLDHPEIPLHNNPAEIALREFVIKKRVSYGTRSEGGKRAWENMMTMLDTCRKLGVNFFEYVRDIFSGEMKMPRLADLIHEQASA